MSARELGLSRSGGSAFDADVWPWQLPRIVCVARRFSTAAFNVGNFTDEGVVLPSTLEHASVKRKAEYLAGRLCAREALLRLTGRAALPKQQASRAPLWPAGVCGSISHTGDEALAVVGHQCDYLALGVDREHSLPEIQAHELADSILTPLERAQLPPCPQAAALRISLIFSLKESLFKALFPLVHIYFDFQDAQVVAWLTVDCVCLELLCDLSPAWRRGRHITARFHVRRRVVTSLVAVPATVGVLESHGSHWH